jgi:hypothetical protein
MDGQALVLRNIDIQGGRYNNVPFSLRLPFLFPSPFSVAPYILKRPPSLTNRLS